jgi:hypothetical protein
MTNGDYGACADQLEDFMRDLEPWRDELMAMSSTPLPDLFHKLAGEHDGAVALLLEELRERDGPRYRLTRHTAPASLSEAASNVLQALLAADLPGHFTYRQAEDLGTVRPPGTRYEALRGRCWPECPGPRTGSREWSGRSASRPSSQPPGFTSVHIKKNVAGPFGPVKSVAQILLNGARAAIPASMVLTFPDRPLRLLALLWLPAWALTTACCNWRIWVSAELL